MTTKGYFLTNILVRYPNCKAMKIIKMLNNRCKSLFRKKNYENKVIFITIKLIRKKYENYYFICKSQVKSIEVQK
jgi:hypothetical protein